MVDTIYVAGYPGERRGDDPLPAACALWRRHGLDVALIPTWPPAPRWLAWAEARGCTTLRATFTTILLPPGAIVVSFGNERFAGAAERFRRAGCRIVWVGMAARLSRAERSHYRRHGPFDRHVFSSPTQREQLEPQFREFGYRERQGRTIPGDADRRRHPFAPREEAWPAWQAIFAELAAPSR